MRAQRSRQYAPLTRIVLAVASLGTALVLSRTPLAPSEFRGTLRYAAIVLPGNPCLSLISANETFALKGLDEPGRIDQVSHLNGQPVIVKGWVESRLGPRMRLWLQRQAGSQVFTPGFNPGPFGQTLRVIRVDSITADPSLLGSGS